MSVFEQLQATEALLKELLAESDKEALLARLREGPFPANWDGTPHHPDAPLERYTMGAALNVSLLAQQFYDAAQARFPLPPGTRVVVGQRILSTWVGPAEPYVPDQ